MFENNFRKPVPQKNNGSCKIKIRNTPNGKTISFEGNCSKEQLEMAKSMGYVDEKESEE